MPVRRGHALLSSFTGSPHSPTVLCQGAPTLPLSSARVPSRGSHTPSPPGLQLTTTLPFMEEDYWVAY